MAYGTDKRPPFIMIEVAVVNDYELDPYTGWLYVIILSYVNGQTGAAFPSLTTLANKANMSRPKVVSCLKTLESKGLIQVKRSTVAGTNESDVNHYFVPQATKQVVNDVNHGDKPDLPQVVNDVNSNYIESNKNELTKDKPRKSTSKTNDTKREALLKRYAEHKALIDEMVAVFETGWTGFQSPPEGLAQGRLTQYIEWAQEAARLGLDAARVKALHTFIVSKAAAGKWAAFNVGTALKYYVEFTASTPTQRTAGLDRDAYHQYQLEQMTKGA